MHRDQSPSPVPFRFERALVAAVVALMVARPLVSCGDPGRLALTTSTGPVSFTLCALIVLFAFSMWRAAASTTRPTNFFVVPLLIAGVGVAAFVSSRLGERYARPGLFVAWEWLGIATVVYLTRRVTATSADNRGLLNAVLASAVSIAGIGVYQACEQPLNLASLEFKPVGEYGALVGDDEFYPELNRPIPPPTGARGTFDAPETLLAFLVLTLPVLVRIVRAGAGRRQIGLLLLALLTLGGMVAAWVTRAPVVGGSSLSSAVEVLTLQPWLGCGPGNYSRVAAGAGSVPGAWLELAATMGIVGLGVFGLALGVSFLRAWPKSIGLAPEVAPSGPRWEFHLGGAAGLVGGFIWAYGDIPAEAPASQVFTLAGAAMLRAALWFVAFALLESVRAERRGMAWSIVIGSVLVVAYGLFSAGPGRAPVLLTMFVLLTIATNFISPGVARPDGPWSRPVRFVAALLTAILAVVCLVVACLPAWGTAAAIRQARTASRHVPETHREYERARPGPPRATALTTARNFLYGSILRPLHDALERDPGNAALWLELARWRRPFWEYQLLADPEDAARAADEIRKAAETAGQLDPHNLASKRSLFEAILLFRRYSTVRQPERVAALNKLIGQIAVREPETEVALRYRLVRMLIDRGDAPAVELELPTLLRLNRVDGSPHGQLTADQKNDVVERALKLVKNPPKELLDEWTR